MNMKHNLKELSIIKLNNKNITVRTYEYTFFNFGFLASLIRCKPYFLTDVCLNVFFESRQTVLSIIGHHSL